MEGSWRYRLLQAEAKICYSRTMYYTEWIKLLITFPLSRVKDLKKNTDQYLNVKLKCPVIKSIKIAPQEVGE